MKKTTAFTLDEALITRLHRLIPPGDRSTWVQAAIEKALDDGLSPQMQAAMVTEIKRVIARYTGTDQQGLQLETEGGDQ